MHQQIIENWFYFRDCITAMVYYLRTSEVDPKHKAKAIKEAKRIRDKIAQGDLEVIGNKGDNYEMSVKDVRYMAIKSLRTLADELERHNEGD